MWSVSENAQKQYVKSRSQPAPESVKRAKELPAVIPLHPIFGKFPIHPSGVYHHSIMQRHSVPLKSLQRPSYCTTSVHTDPHRYEARHLEGLHDLTLLIIIDVDNLGSPLDQQNHSQAGYEDQTVLYIVASPEIMILSLPSFRAHHGGAVAANKEKATPLSGTANKGTPSSDDDGTSSCMY